jgi:serine/threonine protein kinase
LSATEPGEGLDGTPGTGPERRQFQMVHCLGRGGFGEVYRATMVSAGGLRAEVAVKVLHAEVDPSSQAVQRLRDEGRMLGAIRHPAVLRVHDLVLLDGRVALVTEYVDGQDLDKCVYGEDPLPVRALVELIARLAEGLHAAYTAPSPTGQGTLELVHRDIKPANIRLGRHGEVKLLDFGIARAANVQREARTETNAMLGSYLYMAPERFLDNVDSGAAIDVYALGLTLFEGIVRRRLYGDMSLKDLYLLVLDDKRYDVYVKDQLETIPRVVPHQIVALLYKMLDLDPSKRPDHVALAQTCYELADRLPGKPLDRWARTRDWPPVRTVRGMLDGVVVMETPFSTGQTGRPSAGGTSSALLPSELRSPGVVSADRLSASGVIRTVSGTLDRPGVVVSVGFGLVGLVGAVGVGTVVLLALAVAAWFVSGPAEQDLAPVPALSPGEVAPREPRPAPEIAPLPEVAPAPDPAPKPPAPTRPAPPRPEPAPAPVRPQPAPAPSPRPSEQARLVVDGSVKVRFSGRSGTHPPGLLPAGTYEIMAYFGGAPEPVSQGSVRVQPGETVTVKCSSMAQSCEVQP